ncbi:MAG: hypothetical protein ACYTBJ_10265 [Planctomycetota bacterium]
MPKIITVSCNGPNKHINQVDLDTVTTKHVVLRGFWQQQEEIPQRAVLDCRFCTEGKVVITRKMIEENL